MMRRFTPAVIVVALLASACTEDRPTAPIQQPTFTVTYQGLQDQIVALFPQSAVSLQNAALRHLRNIERDLSSGNLDGARKKMLNLVDYIYQKYGNNQLLDPNGSAPPTTEQAVCAAVNSLYEFVGLVGPGGCSDADGATAIVGPAGATVVTGTQQAGTSIPAGALDQTVLLVITRIPDPIGDDGGPLQTNLRQYPRFYDYSIFPEAALSVPMLVGVCVYDPPNPLAPPAEIVPRLRLAHNVGTGIEILPLATPGFLSCSNTAAASEQLLGRFLRFAARVVAPRPLFAAVFNPGGLGGLAGGFSPFGAVDPGPAPDDPLPPPNPEP